MELVNRTQFAVQRLLTVDIKAAEVLAVVVKATFDIAPDGSLKLAEEQQPVVLADEFLGEPGKSSIFKASDIHPEKPGCDLVLRGTVRTGRPVLAAGVNFSVGSISKTVQVFGDRRWYLRMGFSRISDPQPFEQMPLIWENAYGGWDLTAKDESKHACAVYNPVGRGFRSKKSKMPVSDELLPNIENPEDLINSPKDQPTPVGFGFIGRDWFPRVGFAGTYDDDWQANRMPLLPDDFDPRYFDRAAPGLVLPTPPVAGTPVVVRGMNAGNDLKFALPEVSVSAQVLFQDEKSPVDFRLHTLLVDSDAQQLQLTYGASQYVHGRVDNVAAIIVRGGCEL